MTQPQAAPPEQGSGTEAVIAAAAIGLALIAIESQVREQVEKEIAEALAAITAVLLGLLLFPPFVFVTGIELLSQPTVHDALTGKLSSAREAAAKRIRSGYGAAANVALARARRDLGVGMDLPELDATMDAIDRDIDTMFRHAQADIANRVRLAFDGVQGDDAQGVRPVVVRQAVEDAGAALQQRAGAAAGTAVHQGASDAQQAIWTQHANEADAVYRKRWVVTAADPCDMCIALHGTVVALDAEFDHDAGADSRQWRPVWRNLSGPPRHPNCRCQLELVKT